VFVEFVTKLVTALTRAFEMAKVIGGSDCGLFWLIQQRFAGYAMSFLLMIMEYILNCWVIICYFISC
jgi:hypothetical protein